MPILAYIGGYGHSGSTLLESLLTVNSHFVACGEVSRVRVQASKKRLCTCGRPARECPIWGRFYPRAPEAARLSHLAFTLALLDQVSDSYQAMVDSSKTAWGSAATPFNLRRVLGSEFRLIHIVRDPRGVCWSTIEKARRAGTKRHQSLLDSKLFRCVWSSAAWWVANLPCELFGILYPRQYQRIRYEDLAQAPREQIRLLFDHLALEAKGKWDESGTSDNRHQLYGNRMRRQPMSFSQIKEDVRWKSEMPSLYRGLVACLCWPLNLRYRYTRHQSIPQSKKA